MLYRKIIVSEENYPTLDNVTKNFFEKTNHQMDKEQVELLKKSLEFRKKTFADEKYEDNWGGSIFNKSKVLGVYVVAVNEGSKKEDYFLVIISNNPLNVLTRTTGRQGYSCEQISQQYWKGPFQDLAYRNPTIYFYKPSDKFPEMKDLNIESVKDNILKKNNIEGFEWDARLNTRWCVTNKGKNDVGIDPNIYPMKSGTNEKYTNYMVATWLIFENHGFLNYYVAETPYVYVGHSDSTSGGGKYYLPFIGLRYRLGSAGEDAAYGLMKNVGMQSQNKKTTNLYNQSDISSNQQSQITEEQNEMERNLLIKIINNDRLSEKELQEIRDTLILFYGYGRVEISNFTNYELEEELMMLNNL